MIITYSYAPHLSPRAIRWGAVAEHWAKLGHDVEVVAGWSPGATREETLNRVCVHRTGVALEERLRSGLSHPTAKQRHKARNNSSYMKRLSGAGRRLVRYLYSQTWKKLYWPDHNCLWYFPAVSLCRKILKRNSFDVILSSSLPFTDHLVGMRLKRQFPQIPWVLDVGDPFCFLEQTPTNNHALYRRLNYAVDKRVFQGADAISVTSSATADIYSRLFPESEGRIQVIPPLLKPNEGRALEASVFSDSSRIRLVYMGTLYPSVRSPERLLRIFEQLLQTSLGERLELHFIGETKGCESFFQPYRSHFEKKLFLHGMVSHAVAQEAMKECDFLVNIGNVTNYQLPSKIVDYAAARKPILNIETAREDSSAEFLKTYPAVLSLPVLPGSSPGFLDESEKQQLSQVVHFLEESHQINLSDHELWCQPYQVDSIAREYELLIEAACRRVKLDLPERLSSSSTSEHRQVSA